MILTSLSNPTVWWYLHYKPVLDLNISIITRATNPPPQLSKSACFRWTDVGVERCERDETKETVAPRSRELFLPGGPRAEGSVGHHRSLLTCLWFMGIISPGPGLAGIQITVQCGVWSGDTPSLATLVTEISDIWDWMIISSSHCIILLSVELTIDPDSHRVEKNSG